MRSEARALASLLVAALAVLGGSCKTRGTVSIPSFGERSLIAGSPKPAPAALKRLNGVYVGGSARLGSDPVIHATKDTLSVFTSEKVTYAITTPGCIEGGSRLVFEGYWRQSLSTATGLVRFELLPRELAVAVCSGDTATIDAHPELAARLEGATGPDDDLPSEPLGLGLQRRTPPVPRGFVIAAHHGACRTIDECGLSENSLESIRAVESFGASAVELDVRVTRDGVPVLFHDETMSPRLVKGPYCHGPLADLPLAHVRANCTLEYGERLPTLDEALATALEDTELSAVWLDAKVPEAVVPTLAVMAKYRALASAKGRPIAFYIGLAEADTIDVFRSVPQEKRGPCLVELETSDVIDTGCQAWAPRWTRGPMKDDVARMQALGYQVVFWTLDEVEYIDLFVQTSHPNGILTDRAGLVLHRFHTLYAPAGAWP
jgi:glycerophosphoryl diester phosphodiesterase